MNSADSRAARLSTALSDVRHRISEACAQAGRSSSDVMLLPVTKFFPASDAVILYDLGCREFGESREQDAAAKVDETSDKFRESPVRWHMIGHLQRNKAKSVAKWASTIHSVDSARLIGALEKAVTAALDSGERQESLEVLLQVSLDGDIHRGGVVAEDLAALADQVAQASHLTLTGVMTVPPLDADANAAFERFAVIHDRLLRDHPAATARSAGMTGDLEEAVLHGSTCVRVGTAILGPRPLTSPVQPTGHISNN